MSYSAKIVYPDCPTCKKPRTFTLFDGVTWNVSPMVDLAIRTVSGISGKKTARWHPDDPLDWSWKRLEGHPVKVVRNVMQEAWTVLVAINGPVPRETFLAMNPSNGWGSYEMLVDVWRGCLKLLEDAPDDGIFELW